MTNQSGGGGTAASPLVLQVIQSVLAADLALTSTVKWTDLAAPTVTITTASAASRLLMQVTGSGNIVGTNIDFLVAIKLNATYYQLGAASSASIRAPFGGAVIVTPGTAAAQTVKVGYYLGSAGTVNIRSVAQPDFEELRLIVTELAS